MNWLAAVLAVYVIIKAIVSYRKGFARMLLSLSASVLTLVLVWLFAPAVRSFILEHTDAQETLAVRLDKVLSDQLPDLSADVLPEGQELLPDALADTIRETLVKYEGRGVHAVSARLAGLLISAASYGVLFLFLWLGLKIIGYLLHLVTRLPVLRQVNGLLGLVLGLAEAYILISAFFVLITAFAHTSFGFSLMEQVGRSSFLTFVYSNNPLVSLVIKQ